MTSSAAASMASPIATRLNVASLSDGACVLTSFGSAMPAAPSVNARLARKRVTSPSSSSRLSHATTTFERDFNASYHCPNNVVLPNPAGDCATVSDALPAAYRRARAALEAHAAEPLDLEKLARLCGIGVRSLQLGFKRHFGESISGVLQDIRLEQLNARLSKARPGERVIDIAFDLGFSHPGRMAHIYHAKFGESPSATLRKSR